MPLLDHFHPPISDQHHWESFHASWATEVMRTLNRGVLPERCIAEAHVHLGSRVEIDVPTYDRGSDTSEGNGQGSTAVQTWAPPAVNLVMPAIFPDELEIQVLQSSGGLTLVGAIEFVSPGNKDRPETRRAFVSKCASYLYQGIGLIVVDIVTERLANLHDELIQVLDKPSTFQFAKKTPTYTVAYRPRRRETGDEIELWPVPLPLGQPLPVMPLALRGISTVPVDLDTAYRNTCEDNRITD